MDPAVHAPTYSRSSPAAVPREACRSGAPSDPGRGELEIRVEMRWWVVLVVARFAFAGGTWKGPMVRRHVEVNNDAWAHLVGHCPVLPWVCD